METKTPVKTDPLVRVYNKSERQTFDHGAHKAAPSSFATVPQSVADLWYRLFPGIVVEAGVAQKELGGMAAELAAAREKLAASEARIAKLEEDGADPKAKKRIEQLEAELKKLKAEASA